MSLENLLRIGQLQQHETNAAQIARMLAAAERAIADARQQSISPETRLDAGYRAIMQLSMIALGACGYRPSKNKPGHHQTMIQSLVHSVALDTDQIRLLNTFRVKRNAIDYSGAEVDVASVEQCVAAADYLMQHVHKWLAKNRPELLFSN